MKHWRWILTFDPICSQGICKSWSWAMGRSGRGGTPKRWRIERLISCPPCTTSFTQLAVGVTLIFPSLLSQCFLLVFLPSALRTFGNRALLGSNRLRGSNSFSWFVLPSSLPSFYSGLPLPALQPPPSLLQATFPLTLPQPLPKGKEWKINACKEKSRVILLCKREMVRSVDEHPQGSCWNGNSGNAELHVSSAGLEVR